MQHYSFFRNLPLYVLLLTLLNELTIGTPLMNFAD